VPSARIVNSRRSLLDLRGVRSYISPVTESGSPVRIEPPGRPLDDESTDRLRSALASCPDVAFAHLVDVRVEGIQDQPSLSLFVWLAPASMKSLRGSLNLLSETVAGSIPDDRYVDVLILNSAPELLGDVERANCLFVERDAGERKRAREAAVTLESESVGPPGSTGG
jgi:hypothetical protein